MSQSTPLLQNQPPTYTGYPQNAPPYPQQYPQQYPPQYPPQNNLQDMMGLMSNNNNNNNNNNNGFSQSGPVVIEQNHRFSMSFNYLPRILLMIASFACFVLCVVIMIVQLVIHFSLTFIFFLIGSFLFIVHVFLSMFNHDRKIVSIICLVLELGLVLLFTGLLIYCFVIEDLELLIAGALSVVIVILLVGMVIINGFIFMRALGAFGKPKVEVEEQYS